MGVRLSSALTAMQVAILSLRSPKSTRNTFSSLTVLSPPRSGNTARLSAHCRAAALDDRPRTLQGLPLAAAEPNTFQLWLCGTCDIVIMVSFLLAVWVSACLEVIIEGFQGTTACPTQQTPGFIMSLVTKNTQGNPCDMPVLFSAADDRR
eukprot:jgi/Ulvmu1/1179/UM108_0007.1